MRGRRLLPARGAARLQRHDRNAAAARLLGGDGEAPRVLDRLHVEEHQAHARILDHRLGEVGHRDVGFVAGGVHVAHAEALAHDERVDGLGIRAALAHDRDRPVAPLHLVEDGREVRHHAGGEVGEALAIRADQAHAGAPRSLDERLLHAKAFGAGFAEARRHHDGDLDPLRGA